MSNRRIRRRELVWAAIAAALAGAWLYRGWRKKKAAAAAAQQAQS